MQILNLEFESWNIILLKINWVTVLAAFAILFVVVWVFKRIYGYLNKKSIVIDEVCLGIGDSSVKLKYDKKDQEIAYKLWVELSTRKIGLLYDEENDVITEVYNSWYEFFKTARELLKQVPVHRLKYSDELIKLTERVLNEGLRPHLTQWQAKYRKWYEQEIKNAIEEAPQDIQKRYPHYKLLISDLLETNKRMIEYKDLMKEIAFNEKSYRQGVKK